MFSCHKTKGTNLIFWWSWIFLLPALPLFWNYRDVGTHYIFYFLWLDRLLEHILSFWAECVFFLLPHKSLLIGAASYIFAEWKRVPCLFHLPSFFSTVNETFWCLGNLRTVDIAFPFLSYAMLPRPTTNSSQLTSLPPKDVSMANAKYCWFTLLVQPGCAFPFPPTWCFSIDGRATERSQDYVSKILKAWLIN